MWTNVISVKKGQDKEFNFIESEISKITELSTAIEESKTRKFLYLAGLCDYADGIRNRLERVLVEAVMDYYKLNYFEKELDIHRYTHALCALISTLVYMDFDYESAYIVKTISELSSYDLDGIYHFRLRNLRYGWQEVAEMCAELFSAGADENDIYNVLAYVTSSCARRDCVLELKDGTLKNLSSAKEVKVKNLFGNQEFNLIHAVVSTRATRLVCYDGLSKELSKALKNIIKLKLK